ncbi:MAG: hypothetical protein HRU19_05400 [Pseudobacteriovorax sp.]|nr:hypothetical protein [Pseudobacteriovorax sp.]
MNKYLLIIFCLLMSGCGRWAKAKKQTVDVLPVTEYPVFNENVFSLTPARETIGYGGTMVIFNKAADPVDIAALLQASIDSRIAWASIRRFDEVNQYALRYSEDGTVPKTVEIMKADLEVFRQNAKKGLEISRETLNETSETWMNSELDLLFGEDPSRDKADAVFRSYCEAKIFELASNSYFAARTFSERPTPMPFCEPYYAAAQLFDDASCQADPSGKEYFSCLWKSAIPKTEAFNRFSEGSRTAILSLFANQNLESLRKIFALDESGYEFTSDRFKRVVFGRTGDKRNYFSNLVLKQESVSQRVCDNALPDGIRTLCSVFERNFAATDVDLDQDLETIVAIVEGSNIVASSSFVLPDRPDTTFSTKQIFFYFGARRNHENSEADRIYHQIVSGPNLVKPAITDEDILEKVGELEEVFTGKLYPAISGDALKELETREALIADAEKEIEDFQAQYDTLNDAIPETSAVAFTVGNRPNLAHAFMEIRFKVSNHDGILRAYFWLNGYKSGAVLGCFNLENRLALDSPSCTPDERDGIPLGDITITDQFTVDEKTGRIDFAFEMLSPEKPGLVRKERKTGDNPTFESFSDFYAADFYQKTLHLELFPNLVYDHLEVLTGKAFIRKDGFDLEEAAISLWDQNL